MDEQKKDHLEGKELPQVGVEKQEDTGTRVYCGPSVDGAVRQYTAFSGALPQALERFLGRCPEARALVVRYEDFPRTRRELETRGSALEILFRRVKKQAG